MKEEITSISKRKYLYLLRLEKHSNINLDFNYLGMNRFFTIADKAFCRVEVDPKIKDGLWIHGLFSLEKGYGRKLLTRLIEDHLSYASVIRLNCIGDNLRVYYQSFGFIVYYTANQSKSDSSKKYYEMRYSP